MEKRWRIQAKKNGFELPLFLLSCVIVERFNINYLIVVC